MKNDIALTVLIAHLRARRIALNDELAATDRQASEIRGAIQENLALEQQASNGMLGKPRLSCE